MTGVVFFPGAGSFGTEFRLLGQRVAARSITVTYPGRIGVRGDRVPDSFACLVDFCARMVREKVDSLEMPLVLFGHSFGAFVAWETAKRLDREGVAVSGVVLAGADAVSSDSPHLPSTIEEVREYFTRVDSRVLEMAPSPDWVDIVCETAAGDLRLLADYRAKYTRAVAGVAFPVLVCWGRDDGLVTEGGAQGWGDLTTGEVSLRQFAGGHSDFLLSVEFAEWLSSTICELSRVR